MTKTHDYWRMCEHAVYGTGEGSHKGVVRCRETATVTLTEVLERPPFVGRKMHLCAAHADDKRSLGPGNWTSVR